MMPKPNASAISQPKNVKNTATITQIRMNPAIVNVSALARYVGQQYEDDLNTLPLGSYVVVDVLVSRTVTRWLEIFAAVENLFDTTYSVGRTSEGVVSIGAPRIVRGGLRLTF